MKSPLHRPGGALLAGALVAGVMAYMPAAHASDTAYMTGRVTGEGTVGLGGIVVSLLELDAASGDWRSVAGMQATTAMNGTYGMYVVPGSYKVAFTDGGGTHVSEYYDDVVDVDDATPVTAVHLQSTSLDAELAVAGHISGTVTGPGTPAPLIEGVQVAALEEIPNGESSYWSPVAFDDTDASGNYDIGGLPAGTYRVEFGDRLNANAYASEFYNDQATAFTAQDVDVAAGAISDIDAELALESTISGTVTGFDDQPLNGAGVFVYERANGAWAYVDEVTTNVSGQYTLAHLPRGTYRVEFEFETPDGDYLSEAYNNKRYLSGADDIVVGEDQDILAINAKLIPGEHDPVPFTMTAMPTISGTPQVGSTLTVTGGSWTPTPDETYFYWFRGEEFIEGATGTTYVPTAADVGKTLSVLVQVYGPDRYDFANTGNYGPITAVPVAPAPAPAPAPTPAPTPAPAPGISFSSKIDVAGKMRVGSTLTLKNYKALVSGTTVTPKLQWFAGTKKIVKGTKSRLKLTKAMKGKKISVKVTVKVGTTAKTVKVKAGKVI